MCSSEPVLRGSESLRWRGWGGWLSRTDVQTQVPIITGCVGWALANQTSCTDMPLASWLPRSLMTRLNVALDAFAAFDLDEERRQKKKKKKSTLAQTNSLQCEDLSFFFFFFFSGNAHVLASSLGSGQMNVMNVLQLWFRQSGQCHFRV